MLHLQHRLLAIKAVSVTAELIRTRHTDQHMRKHRHDQLVA